MYLGYALDDPSVTAKCKIEGKFKMGMRDKLKNRFNIYLKKNIGIQTVIIFLSVIMTFIDPRNKTHE